jgi:hypothetical protein
VRGRVPGGNPSGCLAVLAFVVGLVSAGPVLPSLAQTSSPSIRLDRRIKTRPFVRSSVSMRDNEGSAYVRRDGSLWLADDNGGALYEVNPETGALKRVIHRDAFESARRFGGGQAAGENRVRDLESLAYDASADALFAFSGSCCRRSVLPTAFRLTRARGKLRVDSYQPLPRGTDFTGAAWNRSNRKLYVGFGKSFRSYRYRANAIGPRSTVRNLGGILGLGFSRSGEDAFVVTRAEKLIRVDWDRRRIVAGWTFDLTRFGIKDSRGVERIGGRFFVSDGFDGRSRGDPMKYAVYVLRLT